MKEENKKMGTEAAQFLYCANKCNFQLFISCIFVFLPCDSISIKLQELEQLIGLLSVSRLLLRCQSIVGHQQRMGSPSYTE